MGERDAVAPSGFDLGNSPLDITRELTGKHDCAVMATTNGTRAILSAASTGVPVLIACARNASAALELAVSKGKRIGIFCSGRKERPCWDDVLCAGFLLSRLVERFSEARFSDGAKLVHAAWRSADNFETSLRNADHALDLEKLGFGADIVFAAKVDAVRAVPEVSEFFEAKGTGPQVRAILRAAALA